MSSSSIVSSAIASSSSPLFSSSSFIPSSIFSSSPSPSSFVPTFSAPFDGAALSLFQNAFLWALIVGFLLAFVLGFGMGANDVANAFGTSVGSKVLTLRNAFILATIMETLGAVLVGYNVTDAMRKEVVNIDLYMDHPNQFLLGQLAILGGGSVWLLTATLLRLPVSTTHSIVGAILGFTLVMNGVDGISWRKIIEIAFSWVLSPALSGFVSASLYLVVDFAVLRRRNPVKCGLRALPVFYFFCIAFNTFAIVYNGSKLLGLSKMSLFAALGISIGFGFAAALIFHFILRPRILSWIYSSEDGRSNGRKNSKRHFTFSTPISENKTPKTLSSGKSLTSLSNLATDYQPKISVFTASKIGTEMPISISNFQLPTDIYAKNKITTNGVKKHAPNDRHQPFKPTPRGFFSWFFPRKDRREDPQTLRMFSTIQVSHSLLLCPNSISPLVALLSVWHNGSVEQSEQTPIWLLLFGVSAICAGLWLLGHRVIETVGQKLSHVNSCSGFTIEFGAAVTALLASKFGLPISTTHCLVGSVVAVGSIKSGEGINWRIFASIATSWLVTLPVSAAVSAAFMFIMKTFLL
ncbi:hypothetical protein niasHS_010582 [Heterodera schachtii]|uniref:Phosphate transporter n=1 Tax=Heterodera schachtii TaxID=97005 RepID=A0ABD2IYQ7_HETSC